MAHNNLAAILERGGEFKGVREHYPRAVETDPGNAEAHNGLATLLEWCGRGDESSALPTGAGHQTSLRPVPLQLRHGLGWVRTAGEAIDHFQRRPAARPDLAVPISTWGPSGPVADGPISDRPLEGALRIRPEMLEAHYQLGRHLGGLRPDRRGKRITGRPWPSPSNSTSRPSWWKRWRGLSRLGGTESR